MNGIDIPSTFIRLVFVVMGALTLGEAIGANNLLNSLLGVAGFGIAIVAILPFQYGTESSTAILLISVIGLVIFLVITVLFWRHSQKQTKRKY